MRLAVFTNQYPGKVNTFFVRDLAGLAACGVEIDVFPLYPEDPALWKYAESTGHSGASPISRERVYYGRGPLSSRAASPRGTGFVRESLRAVAESVPHGPVTAAKTAYAAAKIRRWAREGHARYDQVLGYWGNYAATAASLFARRRGLSEPVSIFLHAGTDLYRGRPYLRTKLEEARTILVCSEFNREFLRERYPDIAEALARKIYVHQHGLDFGELPFERDGRASSGIVAVGGFEKAKGFDDLLRACGILRDRGVALQLELVGDGPQREALRTLAASLSLEDRVRFPGWLPFAEARAAIRRAAVLAHPSIGLGDGAPNVIKEAMALGTPVVASRVAGIPGLLEEGSCGVLVAPRDPAALAESLRSLLERPTEREALAQRARRSAESRFDIWRNGRALAEALGFGAAGEAAERSSDAAAGMRRPAGERTRP
jgi:glycosyltransferase involved in cell wall biosynthesis